LEMDLAQISYVDSTYY